MPDPVQVVTAVSDAATVAEAAIPVLAPFSPLITVVLGIIKAHFNATKGQFPTPAEIAAALPADEQQLNDIWSAWSQSKGKQTP